MESTTVAARRPGRISTLFRSYGFDALIVTVVAATGGFFLSWIPSYSFDESVGLAILERSPGQLFDVLKGIDAVHGLYYFALRTWIALLGSDPMWTRLMSSLAIGLAAGLTSIIGKLLISRQAGFLAGLLLVAIPRANWAATEARPYAMSVLAAAALTLVLIIALRHGKWSWWAAYAALAAFSTTVFIYSVFVVAAHVVVVLVCYRRLFWRYLVAASTGVALSSPVIYFAVKQSGQVSWIKPIGPSTMSEIIKGQWFLDSKPLAVATYALVAVGLSLIVRSYFKHRRDPSFSDNRIQSMLPATVFIPWLLIPLIGIIAVSLVVSPTYSQRYLTNTTPALALLLAWAIVSISRIAWVRTATAIFIVVLAVPAYLHTREPYSKDSDYSQTAAWLHGRTKPGEAVVFARPGYPLSMRVVMYADRDAFVGLDDVMEKSSMIKDNSYWPQEYSFSDVGNRLSASESVGVVYAPGVPFEQTDIFAALTKLGYSEGDGFVGKFSAVVNMSRHY